MTLEAISKTLDCVLLKEHSQIIVHSSSACGGLSMTFTAAFCMKTIFEMASRSYLKNSQKMSFCPKGIPSGNGAKRSECRRHPFGRIHDNHAL